MQPARSIASDELSRNFERTVVASATIMALHELVDPLILHADRNIFAMIKVIAGGADYAGYAAMVSSHEKKALSKSTGLIQVWENGLRLRQFWGN